MEGADRLRKMEIKVGALILASVVVLVGFVLLLGDFRCADDAVLYVDVPTSGNLKSGAPVKVSGVTVGKVKQVELWGGRPDPEHGNKVVQVRVTLRVSGAVPGMLHDDAKFYITTLGALGEKYVEIDPGTPGRPTLSDGAVVDGIGPIRLELLGEDASTIAKDLATLLGENREDMRAIIHEGRNLIEGVSQVVSENREDLRGTLRSLRATAENLERLSGALREAAGNGEDLKKIIASLRGVAESLEKDLKPTLERMPLTLERMSVALEEARAFLGEGKDAVSHVREKVGTVLERLEQILTSIRDGRGSIGALLSDRELYDDLVEFLKEIKRNPWKLLRKP